MENVIKVLYLQLLKDLNGCMDSALLWYDLYTKTIKSYGFVINLYDWCIAKITIDGKQCMIAWYVEDNKVLHIDEEVNKRMIEMIDEHFGELTVFRGENTSFWEWA